MRILIAVAAMLISMPASMGEGVPSDRDLMRVQVTCSPEYFIGMPKYMVVTMSNPGPRVLQVPIWQVDEAYVPISFQLKSSRGEAFETTQGLLFRGLIHYEVHTRDGRPVFRETMSLQPGETRRMLFNAGPLLQSLKLPAGQYSMEVRLWGRTGMLGKSGAIDIEGIEGYAGNAIGELKVSSGGVECMAEALTPDSLKVIDDPRLRQEIALSMIFRRCFLDHVKAMKDYSKIRNIADINIDDLLPLIPPLIKPDLELYRLDILLGRKDEAKAQKAKEWIIKNCPDLKAQVSETEKGAGPLSGLRGGRQ